ncbi:MAG: alpha/beta fold hydrolase [Corynebacterium sp.]|uniref:alpha/beta fold hydrolase n=1 Tax=Corynebacterium sp. TaxID=1720 RepID=UPI003F9DDFD0
MTLLHTRITGRRGLGHTVVLLGALGSSVDMWAAVQDRLSVAGHGESGRSPAHVIAIDHRGHGASTVPGGQDGPVGTDRTPATVADLAADVTETLDRLGLDDSGPEQVDLVGLSIGGAVAQHIAGSPATRDRVRSLTLMCTGPSFGSPEDWTAKATGVRANGRTTLQELAEGTVQRWLTPGYLADHPATGAAIVDMIARTAPEGYAQCCEVLSTFDGTGYLAGVTAPTLTVAGATDPTCPPETLKAMSEAVASNGVSDGVVRHEVVDPGAHLLPVQQPDAVADLLAGHIGL